MKPEKFNKLFVEEAKAALRKAGGGGASCWKDIAEKTGKVCGDTLTWDGNTEGLVTLTSTEILGCFVKISDAVPTISDCENGMFVKTADGAEKAYTADEMNEIYNTIGVVGSQLGVYVIPIAGFVLLDTFTFPEAGVWVAYMDNMPYPTTITIPGYTGFVSEQTVVTPIPTEYLPEHLQFGEVAGEGGDTFTWDGSTEGLEFEDFDGYILYRVSEAIVTADDIKNGMTVTFRGNALEYSQDDFQEQIADMGYLNSDEGFYFIPGDNFSIEEGVTFHKAGIYHTGYPANFGATTITIPGYTGFGGGTTIVPLDEKYIPDTIARVSDIIGAMEASY